MLKKVCIHTIRTEFPCSPNAPSTINYRDDRGTYRKTTRLNQKVERTGETFPAPTAAPAQRREEMEMNLSRFTRCAFLKRLVWK